MIKFYRILSLLFSSVATIYVLIEFHDLIIGNSSLNSPEDLSILLFIIVALYFTISFSIETRKYFRKNLNQFEIIDVAKIERDLKLGEFSKVKLYGNLFIGLLIVCFMTRILLSEPIEEFIDDSFRLISILLIAVYGLIQVHFSFIVRKKLKN